MLYVVYESTKQECYHETPSLPSVRAHNDYKPGNLVDHCLRVVLVRLP